MIIVQFAELRMPSFQTLFGSVSHDHLDEAEARLGITFPADYREFLATINGGVPDPQCVLVPMRSDALVGLLYGIGPERTPGDLEWEQQEASLWDELPPGMIAIGHDPGGNRWMLSTLSEVAGKVWF